MDKELIADIRNKLQPIKTTLELLAQDKPILKDFTQIALDSLKDIETSFQNLLQKKI